MIKIGIICYPTFGGSGIVASELGMGLASKYEVHFISYEKPVRINLNEPNIFFHKVTVPIYPLFEYPPYELALTARIVEVVKDFSLDLLHVHYAIPHAYAAVNAQQILSINNNTIPIVTTLHGTDITLVGKSPFVLSSVNYAINKSTLVTCVSKDLKEKTLQYFNIQHDIKVIPNFINIDPSNLNVNKKTNSTKILTHISNFRPVKRTLDVVKVFNNIQKNIKSELIMIGDGPDLEKTKDLVKAYGLGSSVHFVGKSNNIQSFLKKTDLFLLPSESESFGLVALEAMSFGVPVITTNSGGIVELVLDNHNGFTCHVGDIENMTLRANNLLLNNQLYDKFSIAAFNTAKQYDTKTIITLYESCYLDLIK